MTKCLVGPLCVRRKEKEEFSGQLPKGAGKDA